MKPAPGTTEQPMNDRTRRYRWIHWLVLALYTVLAVALTWPLARNLSTHVPGSYNWAFDEYTFVWNNWWFRYSLFDLGQSPLYSTHTFYPLGISLVLYTYNLFNAVVSLPLQPYLSLPAISNLLFLFSTVFSGYGAFLLVRKLILDRNVAARDSHRRSLKGSSALALACLAAFLSGLIYAFGSYRLVYAAIGHYDMWSTTWIPFYALFLTRTIREPNRRNAIMAGLFLVLAMLCEMIFGVFLGLLTVIVLAFVLGSRARRKVAGGLPALLGRLLLLALVVVLLYAPLLVPVLREMFGGYELAGWGDAEKLSVDLAGLVTPTALHPLGGDWTDTLRQTREGTARFRDVNTVFLGWAGLALAMIGAVRCRRRLAAWITSAVVFTLFCLGPLLQINGRSLFDLDGLQVNVPLPFILLHYVPVVKANRVPNRFGVVLMLALAVLAGFGAYWLLRRVAGRRNRMPNWQIAICWLPLAALILFEHWSVPIPLTDARIPAVYEQIASDPDDFSILQLPLGWRNSFGVQGAESTQTQYYQTFHHKRLLSGNISRNPPYKFDYFRQVPILESLMTIQTYGQVDAERRASDRTSATGFVGFYDIRYVVVAPGIPGRPPYVDTGGEAVRYIEDVLPVEKIYDQDGWMLYRVVRPQAVVDLRLDFGSSDLLATMATGEGWGGTEVISGATARWAVAQDARVFLPAASGTAHRLTLTALPFDYSGAEQQGVALWVNGHRLETLDLAPGWGTYEWDVPAHALWEGLNDVRFRFTRLDIPNRVLADDGVISGTGVRTPVAIEVNSGGPAGFAYISVGDAAGGDAEDGSVHQPGYNLAVLHPRTGRIIQRRGFDVTSTGSKAEVSSLVDFLQSVPNGQIVIAALQGEGLDYLTDTGVASFRTIGAQGDPRQHTGASHAIIGVKGAAPGTASEVTGPGNGWLRVAPDLRTLAMAVDVISWHQIPVK